MRARLRALRAHLVAGVLCLALALALTWPLASRIGEAIPLGTEGVSTVPLFNLWTLWWNADRLGHLYQGYWDAPIFHPTPGTFAFSEPQPLTGLVAAAVWALTGNPAVAYNAMLLLALALNGWAAWGFFRALGLGAAPALAGGALVETLPFVLQELGVLQLVGVAGFFFTFHALVLLSREPSPRRGAALGLALAFTASTCAYYALFLGIVLVAGGWLLVDGWRRRTTWTALGVAAGLAGLLVAPLALGQLRATDEMGFRRSTKTVERHAARIGHYGATAWEQLVPWPGVEAAAKPGDRAFFPGTVELLLAVGGLVWGWRRRRWRRFAVFALVTGTVGLVLSLGPNLPIVPLWGNLDLGALSPHRVTAAIVPGFARLRSLFRFAVVVQLAVACLAALGVEALWQRLGATKLGATKRTLRIGVVLAVAVLAAGEMWPGRQELRTLPALDAEMAWIDWIETATPEDAVLAFAPFPREGTSAAYQGTVQWMFWGMRHGRPMVNGYSGFFPRAFRELKDAMEHFPDPASLDRLGRHGVSYCLVLRAFARREQIEVFSGGRLVWVFGDGANGVDIYELTVEPTLRPRRPRIP